MDATSIVTSHPAFGRQRGAIAGAPALAVQVPAGEGAMKLALSGASGDIGSQSPRRGIDLRSAGWKPSKQPNPLDSVAQPYQGGAVVALDFTLEEARPKAACSICPTTT